MVHATMHVPQGQIEPVAEARFERNRRISACIDGIRDTPKLPDNTLIDFHVASIQQRAQKQKNARMKIRFIITLSAISGG